MKEGLLIAILFVCFGCKNTSEVKSDTTMYYFIRHAEKDRSDPSNKNPNLIEKGLKRAENWEKHFKNVDFDAIYSTNYFRTIQTVQPTADAKKLEITIYNPSEIDYDAFLNKTKNKTVLVVGHSNTTPTFVNKIIGHEKFEAIDDSVNSKLYSVTINKEKITSNVITID